ncbi:MAG: G5 domain-containing protein [Firmicutes bacterium]|nr:G5 domain-containing protein [Bacillota bacterium]
MNKKVTGTLRALACAAIFSLSVSAQAKELEGNSIRVILDGKTNYYHTSETTVREFLVSNNIELGKDAVVNFGQGDKITNNMELVIQSPLNIVVKVDDEAEKTVTTSAKTVGDYIGELKSKTGYDYSVKNASAFDELSAGKKVELISVKDVVSTSIEDVPYETQQLESADLYVGETKVKQVGVIGAKKVTTTTTYIGNVDSGCSKSEELVVTPVPEIVMVGTKQKENTIPGLNATYSKVLTLDATAYCPCGKCCGKYSNGITANGMKAGYGVVAVDPRVIPLGTKLYVEGYGYCIAADTGGAIKGNRIDLCYGTHSQALASGFGHTAVKVYILG